MKLWRKENKGDTPPRYPAGRDLRTRYVPRAKIRPFYLQMAPWLDLLFILFFLVLSQSRLVLRPGIMVSLPEYEGTGVQSGEIAVLTSAARGGQSSPILYFSDAIYRLEDEERVKALEEAFARSREVDIAGMLTLYADKDVAQAHVMQVMDMAAKAGFDQINVGTAPPKQLTP